MTPFIYVEISSYHLIANLLLGLPIKCFVFTLVNIWWRYWQEFGVPLLLAHDVHGNSINYVYIYMCVFVCHKKDANFIVYGPQNTFCIIKTVLSVWPNSQSSEWWFLDQQLILCRCSSCSSWSCACWGDALQKSLGLRCFKLDPDT